MHQVSFRRQVDAWMTGIPRKHTEKDAEDVSYRIRQMMAHLRCHAYKDRSPSSRFAMLSGVMSMVAIDKKREPATSDNGAIDD